MPPPDVGTAWVLVPVTGTFEAGPVAVDKPGSEALGSREVGMESVRLPGNETDPLGLGSGAMTELDPEGSMASAEV